MMAVVAPQPDGAEELALVERPVPRAGAGRGADQGRGRRHQPPRHPPTARPLPAAAGSAGHPWAGACRRGRRSRPRRRAADRPKGLRPGRRRRLCRILRGSGRNLPAGARCAVARRGRGDARDLVHGLGQSLRTGLCGRRRLGAGARRHERDRDDGDRARHAVRPACDRDLRKRGEMRSRARARRRSRGQLPRAGFRRGGPPPDRRAKASTSCSTWSAATMCRAT